MSLTYHHREKLFRQFLQKRSIALAFFKAYLPSDIYSSLNLDTLQVIDKSYLSPDLAPIQSDLVYHCHIKGYQSYLPILFLSERPSTEDPHMAFRLLKYKISLMEDHLKAGDQKLPMVLPLCVYSGGSSPYPYSRDIYDDFEDPQLAKDVVFKAVD